MTQPARPGSAVGQATNPARPGLLGGGLFGREQVGELIDRSPAAARKAASRARRRVESEPTEPDVDRVRQREVVEAFFAADLFLFPSLIECSPLVLFEAAAAGTPFIATDVGNSREIAEWTGAGLIA